VGSWVADIEGRVAVAAPDVEDAHAAASSMRTRNIGRRHIAPTICLTADRL